MGVCVCVRFQPNLEGYEIHEVTLSKMEGQSLGISIVGYNRLTSQGERETAVLSQKEVAHHTELCHMRLSDCQPSVQI